MKMPCTAKAVHGIFLFVANVEPNTDVELNTDLELKTNVELKTDVEPSGDTDARASELRNVRTTEQQNVRASCCS